MEESSVKTILRGLRAYLLSNLKCDESFISSLHAKGLLNDSEAGILRSSVSQGGQVQDKLVQYMEWYYDQKMLEKFCVFLDDHSKLAKPLLGQIAERIRQEMEKHKPGPIHQPDPQQPNGPPSSSPATQGEPTPTVSTMDERSQKIEEIVDKYRSESTKVSLPEIPELQDDFDSIMGALKAELSFADRKVICKLEGIIQVKYRRYIHGVKTGKLPHIPDTASGLFEFIAEKSTPYEILFVHHAIDVLDCKDLKGKLQTYEFNLANHLQFILKSYKKRNLTLPRRKNHTHLALVSKEQTLLSLVLHIKEYFMKYLQLEETIFEGFGEGCTVLFYSILKVDAVLLAPKILSHSAELKRMFDITHLVVFDYFACDLERATIELPNTIHQKDAQLKQKDDQLREQDAELKKQHTLLQQKDAQLKQKDAELRHKDEEGGRQYAILLKECQKLKRECDQLRRERDQLQQESSLSAKPILNPEPPKEGEDENLVFASQALHGAAYSGSADLIETVVRNHENIPGFDIDCLASGRTPLHTASERGHVGAVAKLVELRCDINKISSDGFTALHYAVKEGHVEIVAKLVELGCDTNKTSNSGLTALHFAAGNGHVDMVASLVRLGVDPNQTTRDDGLTALHLVAILGHVDVVVELVKLGCDVNRTNINGWTALHGAAENGHVDVVSKLIEFRCDKDRQALDGRSALHVAAKGGHVDAVARLIELGCDKNKSDLLQRTALHWAAGSGHVPVVTKLIELGCDTNKTNNYGATALHVAAEQGHPNVIAELVRLGMDVNETASEGMTALHLAAAEGHLNVVTKLLELECDRNKTNARGQTALDIAQAAGHIDIVAKLIH